MAAAVGGSASGQGAPEPAASTATPPAATSGAEQTLLERAEYWRARGRGDLAGQALEQLLKSVPDHPQALYLLGLTRASEGNTAEARQYLARLRAAHPGQTSRIAELEAALRTGSTEPSAIVQARRLAQAGKFDEAARSYREAFKGTEPPERYALEYYQTLAGTREGATEARRGLQERVQTTGGSAQSKLALAKVLTYRDSTRREGIRQLAELSQDPAVASDARSAWRQALIWLGGSPSDRPLYDAYLSRFPNDTELRNRRERAVTVARSARPAAPDRYAEARTRGFAQLNSNNLSAAEETFRDVLRARPNDRDARAGLGIVRLRQKQFGEARDLLQRAVSGSSSMRRKYAEALQSATFWDGMNNAQAAFDAGRMSEAQSILDRLVRQGGGDVTAAQRLLGDVLFQQDQLAAAERQYRLALQRQPNDVPATLGLFNVYSAQGREAEALRLAEDLEARSSQIPNYPEVQSEVLRLKARQLEVIGDGDGAFEAYQQAIVVDPSNPWLRLDFARFLDKYGERDQATGMIQSMVDTASAPPAALHAAAIFYNERRMYPEATAALDRIPTTRQTPEMRELRQRIYVDAEVNRAKALAEAGSPDQATRILEQLNRTPPVTDAKTAAVASALADIGSTRRAQALLRQQVVRGDKDAKTLIDYTGVLLRAGQEAEAAAYLRDLDSRTDLTRDQRQQLEDLKAGLAVAQADRAREREMYADAYDILYPHLADSPENPALLMALARLYASAGRPEDALGIYASILERDPRNLDTIRGAVGAAIDAKNYDYASALLDKAVEYHPREPRIYYLMGEVARASGDNTTARRALETALELRQDELARAASPVTGAGPAVGGNPFRNVGRDPGLGRVGLPPRGPSQNANPFRPGPQTGSLGALEGAEQLAVRSSDGADDNIQLASADPDFAVPHQSKPNHVQLAQSPTPIYAQTPIYAPPPFVNPSERQVRQPDNLLRDIEESLVDVRRETGPTAEVGIGLRYRDGDKGLDRLTETTGTIEGTFPTGELGRFVLTATPTYITAGSLDSDAATLARFGTNPLGGAADPGTISDTGVGLGLGWEMGPFALDVGSTPLGFQEESVVGGVSFAPAFDEDWTLRLAVERRAVKDSVLSYAGMTDERTGVEWGGVTRTGGSADLSYDDGAFGAYAGAGFYVLDGNNVADNELFEFSTGGYYRFINEPDRELRAGVNLTYFTYDENLRRFTLGHGGYFSPQDFFSFSIPVEYTARKGKVSYAIGGAVGVQSWSEDGASVFPNNPELQSALETRALFDPSISTTYDSEDDVNIGFNLHGQVEYDVTPATAVGAAAAFDNAADWFEATGRVYMRHTFGAEQ